MVLSEYACDEVCRKQLVRIRAHVGTQLWLILASPALEFLPVSIISYLICVVTFRQYFWEICTGFFVQWAWLPQKTFGHWIVWQNQAFGSKQRLFMDSIIFCTLILTSVLHKSVGQVECGLLICFIKNHNTIRSVP
jgi:hypothetical protein